MNQTIKRIDDARHRKLSNCISKYRESREKLINITRDTLIQFDELNLLLKSTLMDSLNSQLLTDLKKQLGEVKNTISNNYEVENPAMTVLGEVQAGKSFFLNTLMRKSPFTQKPIHYATRLVRVCYSKKPFMKLYDGTGKLIVHHKHKQLKDKYVRVRDEDIDNPDEISKYLVAGVDSSFLKCGIDLIDTPGLSQNQLLTNLSQNSLENILPLAIYVIDGNKSVKQSDITQLYELKDRFPNLTLIFFITHLDTNDDDFNSSPTYERKTVIANRKMELAFQKLQKNNFIPHTVKSWMNYSYIHGASLNKVSEFLHGKNNFETKFHHNCLKQFEKALLEILEKNFHQRILEATNLICQFQVETLTKLIHNANDFSNKTQENLSLIELISKTELELFNKISLTVSDSKNDLISRLMNRLHADVNLILEPIQAIEYPKCLNIPENGVVTDKSQIVGCQNVIIKAMVQGLEEIVKDFVNEEFFKKYVTLLNKIASNDRKSVYRVKSKTDKSPYMKILESKIKNIYKVIGSTSHFDGDVNFSKRASSNGTNNPSLDMNGFVNVVLGSIKNFLSVLNVHNTNTPLNETDGSIKYEEPNENNVKSSQWKLKEAKKILEICDHHNLAEKVCNSLLDDVERKHASFKTELELEKSFIEKSLLCNFDAREKFNTRAPQFFLNFLKAFSIKSSYEFKDVKRLEQQIIGRGGQGKVYKCEYGDGLIAEKVITYNQAYALEKIAEEVYYSRQFTHYRLLPSIGAIIDEENNQISIFYELMRCNLSHYLTQRLVLKEKRIEYAVQIAEGIEYLHNQGIIHRDLKLTNILLDYDDNVHLSDYGFCKSEALLRFSTVGTPIHTAPEILLDAIYTKKVDIYSFGILLWYLFEGTGRPPENARQAYIANYHVWNRAPISNIRPERREKIPDTIWMLMEQCWAYNFNDRPNIEYVLTYLRDLQINR